jgi:hypothetical protein
MAENESWYLAERAEQLAIIHLSRRDDLVINRQSGADYGVDLLVSLTRDSEYTGRVFGVIVKALKSYRQPRPIATAGAEIRFDLRELKIPDDLPFPLCLFVFVMEDDAGHYQWIKRPAYGLDGRPWLLMDRTGGFKKLNDEAIDLIVSEVSDWYESRIKIPA